MSELTSPLTSPANDREGYVTVDAQHAGHTYQFTFYQGFVRLLKFRPKGGGEIKVYEQEGTYHVPQPPEGRKGPDAVSTVTITGGPDSLDIELRVDDSPQDARYRGPIEGFEVRTQPRGTPGGGQDASVTAIRGADQIRSIVVRKRTAAAHERAYDGGETTTSEDTFTVENMTKTCPPDC